MSKKTLLNALKKEHQEAEELFQELVKNDESETVRRVAHAIMNTYKQCIRLTHKHLKN